MVQNAVPRPGWEVTHMLCGLGSNRDSSMDESAMVWAVGAPGAVSAADSKVCKWYTIMRFGRACEYGCVMNLRQHGSTRRAMQRSTHISL